MTDKAKLQKRSGRRMQDPGSRAEVVRSLPAGGRTSFVISWLLRLWVGEAAAEGGWVPGVSFVPVEQEAGPWMKVSTGGDTAWRRTIGWPRLMWRVGMALCKCPNSRIELD